MTTEVWFILVGKWTCDFLVLRLVLNLEVGENLEFEKQHENGYCIVLMYDRGILMVINTLQVGAGEMDFEV